MAKSYEKERTNGNATLKNFKTHKYLKIPFTDANP